MPCYWIASEAKRLPSGQVAEWSKAHAWKVCRRETVSRVRIPVCPPPHPHHSCSWYFWRYSCARSGIYNSALRLMPHITSHITIISTKPQLVICLGWVFPCFSGLTGNLTGNFSFFDVLERLNLIKYPMFIGVSIKRASKITGNLIGRNREFSSKTGPLAQTTHAVDHAG